MEIRAHDNTILGFPGGLDRKEFPCNAGDLGSIPGSGRSPREGNGNTPVFLPGELHEQKSFLLLTLLS